MSRTIGWVEPAVEPKKVTTPEQEIPAPVLSEPEEEPKKAPAKKKTTKK